MATMQSPEEVKRRRKFAEALMAQSVDASPVQHPMQAVARALQGLYGGYLQGQAGREEKENEQRAMADLMAVYGGQSQPQPQQPAAPQTTAPIQPQPSGQPSDPRGIRNNNPLNIEAGRFTQSQPGYAGSDGRFARFASADQGMAAADSLLNVYGQKHGLNTITGIVSRWAPAGDGNNVGNYAGFVAKRLGVAPDQPLDMNKPEVRQAIAGAMAEFENGRPARMAQAGPPQVPQSSPQMPAAAGGMPPNMAQLMRAASNPWLGRTGQVLAGEIVKKQFTPRDQWVDERGPDGSFYQRNLATGERKVVEKSGVLTPEAFEQQVRLAKEKKPETNIDLRRESKFNEEGAKILTKQFGEILESSRNAVGVNAEFDALRELSQRIGPTGKTSEITLALGPYAEALGIKIDKLSDLQAYNAIVRKMAPRMRPPGSGATSDFEFRQFLEALPSLGKTPEGNELIANTNQALLQHQIAAGDIAGLALSGKLSAEEAMKKLRELPDPMALWKKSRGSLPTDKASGGISIRPEVLERLKKYQEGGQ